MAHPSGFPKPSRGPHGHASGHLGTCKNYPERPWRRPCIARERPGTSKDACRFTWTRPERKQKIPKHRKASKCLQNSTNSHAFEPEHELSKSIIGATQGPQGRLRGPPQALLKHLEAPSRASLETSLGPRGSPGTLQERSRDSLKGSKCQKKVPKAYQRPARRSLEAQEDTQRHKSRPPSLKGRSKLANLQPQVPSVVPSSLHQTGPPSIEASKPPVALAGYAKRKQFVPH